MNGPTKVFGLVGAASLALALASGGADARNLGSTASANTVHAGIKSNGSTPRLGQRGVVGAKWGYKGLPGDPCRTSGKCQPRAARSWRQ